MDLLNYYNTDILLGFIRIGWMIWQDSSVWSGQATVFGYQGFWKNFVFGYQDFWNFSTEGHM